MILNIVQIVVCFFVIWHDYYWSEHLPCLVRCFQEYKDRAGDRNTEAAELAARQPQPDEAVSAHSPPLFKFKLIRHYSICKQHMSTAPARARGCCD